MGVLNLTPDSFSDGGMYNNKSSGYTRAIYLFNKGCDILDIGGESTRPGSKEVKIDIEYILKSTITNEVLYTRYGSIVYDASVSSGVDGIYGALADIALSALNTAATKYVDLARVCNGYSLSDLPQGKYSPMFGVDGDEYAGPKQFRVRLNSKSY